MKRRVVIIVQARMGATRLPSKVLLPVLGRPLLSYLLERLRRVKQADAIVVATTTASKDDPIVLLCEQEGIPTFRGSEEDVLERYLLAARAFQADLIVRITADCPLLDPALVDQLIEFYQTYDYASNTLERTFPRGMDVEIFSIDSLEKAASEAKTAAEREHVTPYFYSNPKLFRLGSVIRSPNEGQHRWTVDTPEDFALIKTILEAIYPHKPDFTLEDLLDLIHHHPDWSRINSHIQQKPI